MKFTILAVLLGATALSFSATALGATIPLGGFYPNMVDPNLGVTTVVNDPGGTGTSQGSPNNLFTPTGVVFLPNSDPSVRYDMLVIEKNTGMVRRIRLLKDGTLMKVGASDETAPVVLDLAVNAFSERGLLSIALHPNLSSAGGKIYLFFTEKLAADNTPFNSRARNFTVNTTLTSPLTLSNGDVLPSGTVVPAGTTLDTGLDNNSIASTVITGPSTPALGADTTPTATDAQKTPLLGNRVARFDWNPTAGANARGSLTYDANIIRLRSFQNDRNSLVVRTASDGQRYVAWVRASNGNHNGGKMQFGPDGKLYIEIGDVGRRGLMQNIKLPLGINIDGTQAGNDDVFGGPAPDDAHFTGVIVRLNDDGSAPSDNPFYSTAQSEALALASTYSLNATKQAEVEANLRKLYAYGVRNGFGLSIDPASGKLWNNENGGKTFSEVNQIPPGANLGWVQMMGPASRMDYDPSRSLGFFDGTPPAGLTGLGDYKANEALWGIGRSGSSGVGGVAAPINTFSGPRGIQQPRFLAVPIPRVEEIPGIPNSFFPGVPGSDLPGHTIADTMAQAIGNLYMPPGAVGRDPLYSVKQVVENAGLGFISGTGLGGLFAGDLLSGSAVARQAASTAAQTANPPAGQVPNNGYYPGFDADHPASPFFYPFILSSFARPEDDNSTDNFGNIYRLPVAGANRDQLNFSDPALADGVADNRGVDDWKQEQGSLLFGKNFGVTTDIVTAPDGKLLVLSLTRILTGTGSAAGNQSVTGRIYMVSRVFQFSGFFAPVDNGGVLNVAKAGQIIAVKWRLQDASGVPVTNLSKADIYTVPLDCSSVTAGTDVVENYATGSSGVQNLGDGYYQINWKTDRSYAGSCKQLLLDLDEGIGIYHTANFQFK